MAVTQDTINSAMGPQVADSFAGQRAQLDQFQQQRQALLPQVSQSQQDETKIQQDTAQAEQAPRAALANFQPRVSQLPTPTAPKAPEQPKIDPQEFKQAAGAMLVISGLLGAFTRSGWTGAITTMTGAMKGLQEGNDDAVARSTAQYKNEVSSFQTQLEALKADREGLDKMDQRDLGALRQQLEFIAHKNDAELVAAKARTHSYTDALKELDSQITHMETAVNSANRVTVSLEEHLDKKAAGSDGPAEALTPAGLKLAEELTRKGIPLPGGYSKAGMARGNTILNAMAGDNSGGDVAGDRASYKADAASLGVQQKRADAIDAGMNKIGKDIQTVQSVIGKGNAGFGTFINKPLNSLRSAASDPTLAPYRLAVQQVATEYERLLAGGQLSTAQLHQGAQEDAKRILNENMSVAEVNAVLPIMIREMQNARSSTSDELSSIKSRISGKSPAPASPQDAAALEWANAHPDDPRAAKIKAHLGQ